MIFILYCVPSAQSQVILRPHVFDPIFAFLAFAFGIKIKKKIIAKTDVKTFTAYFLPVFMISDLTLKSLIHFELILCLV